MAGAGEAGAGLRPRKSGAKGKKVSWRKILISDTSSADVTATILNRLAPTTSQEGKGKRRRRSVGGQPADAVAFSLDSTGATLGRRLRDAVGKQAKGVHVFSPYHEKAVKKLLSTERNPPKESSAVESSLVDLWAGPVVSTNSESPKRRRKLTPGQANNPLAEVPHVKLPLPGQSSNPDPEEHAHAMLSAAAPLLEKERQAIEVSKRLNPVTAALMEYLPKATVEKLSSIEKQRALFYLTNLVVDDSVLQSTGTTTVDECKLKLLAAFVEGQNAENPKTGCGGVVSSTLVEDFAAFLREDECLDTSHVGQKVVFNAAIDDGIIGLGDDSDGADADVPKGEGADAATTAVWENKPVVVRKKSHATRKRFERHLKRLSEAVQEKQHRQFLHSILAIKKVLRDIDGRDERLKARVEYRRAKAEAIAFGRRTGTYVKFKSGTYIFEEAPPEVLLPDAAAQAGGSLRRLPLSGVPSCAIYDRAKSFERRGLVRA